MTITLVAITGSTNEDLMELARQGAPSGQMVVADEQHGGRGRRTGDGGRRSWFSPPGRNLYLSILLRGQPAHSNLSTMTLVAGVEVAKVLQRRISAGVQVKWPNDLWIGDRKVGGILCEALSAAQGVEGIVCGVGLNINLTHDEVPKELQGILTSLHIESGQTFDRLPLIFELHACIVAAHQTWLQTGLETFLGELQARDALKGRHIRVDGQEEVEVVGIADDGSLEVIAGSESRNLIAGEVSLKR